MASIEELKQRIDLHDLADKLGLERPHSRGNYKSPSHPDESPSLSIFANGTRWKDHSTDEGGTCIDLVMVVEEIPVDEAINRLHELYNIPKDKPDQPRREKTFEEGVADRCLSDAGKDLMDYLLNDRSIGESAIEQAIKGKSIGWNTFTSTKRAPGEVGHGGPAAAFIVRTLNPGHVAAVDMRYLDPALNGGCKTQTIGEKSGHVWTADLKLLKTAKRIIIAEAPINSLSVDSCRIPGVASVATRGTGTVKTIDWRFLKGKEVVIAMDNDPVNEKTGYCPGQSSGWKVYEQLTGLNISAMLLDQADWWEAEWNDLNDVLKDVGQKELKKLLSKLQPWIIPGVEGGEKVSNVGKPRLFLPSHDWSQYWRFRVKSDFTTYMSKEEEDEEGNKQPKFEDLCGFRVAAISRVRVASAMSMMSGEADAQPRILFSVSVQAPRHGADLMRKVLEDEQLNNIDHWRKFGPVYKPSQFLRMLNILERSTGLGARHAVNFVGLAWLDGKLVLNEGPDCYFTDPDKQCPYHNLIFPGGSKNDAKTVIHAYQRTFCKNSALIPLVWGLGGHLKTLLGFWPHLVMQADKGAGKSTLIKRLERTLGFTMFSGQSLQTEFRLLTSISATSHPVGWEEISARKQEVIDKAVAMLQESYQYTVSRRGSEMTEYVLSAPVLLAGEDVPVRSLLGKLIRTDLTGKMGPLMREDLPRFPVRQWLNFLVEHYQRNQVRELYNKYQKQCLERSRASGDDKGAVRMAGNYAALLLAWRLLCEFAGLELDQGNFRQDVITEMNTHISETSVDREPWVWIMEIALSEIAAGRFQHPYKWEQIGYPDQEECLLIRTSHIMDHIAHASHLRDRWNALPVKSDRVFKRQLKQADVFQKDEHDNETLERTIGNRRVSNLCAVSLGRLETFGLYATPS
jgi:hypothetical protein